MKNRFPTKLLSLLLLAAPAVCLAETIQILDENFDGPLTTFTLATNASANATANISLGDVAGSQGIVYMGTWQISPGMVEFSSGTLFPQFPPLTDYQLDPGDVDGITAVSYSIDAVLNGFPGDSISNLFTVLVIFQRGDDGQIDVFSHRGIRTSITNTTLETVTVDLAVDDFEDVGGRAPNLGPDGGPISFGIQLGALFDSDAFTGFEQGHLSIDNWQVSVEVPDRVFEDRFTAAAGR